jgi:tetratricopeptide (TPR) repeat protein
MGGCLPSRPFADPEAVRRAEAEYNAATARRLSTQAEAAHEAGNTQQALALFTKALEADPANIEAHIGIGDIHQEQARRIDPGNFASNYKLGLMYHLMNRLREAISTYLSALTIDPANFDANLNLATAYLQIGEPTLALPYAERAVKINASSQPAQVNLGSIYSALGRHDDAVVAYRAAADLGELAGPVAVNLVNALVKSGKYQRALNVLQTLIRTDPQGPYFERLGYVHFKLGEYDQSIAAYEKALAANPNDSSSLNGLGVNLMTRYIQAGRTDQRIRDRALEAWRTSVRINPAQTNIVDLISRYGTL